LQNTHGHNPRHATTATPQLYQHQAQNAGPAHSGPPPSPGQAQPKALTPAAQPAFSTPPGVTPHNEDFVSRLSERLGGRAVFKRLLITTFLFFTLFAVIAAWKFIYDVKNNQAEQIAQFETTLIADAGAVDRALISEIEWIDTALALRGTPQQIVSFAARSRNIVGAALINGNGSVLADTPGAGVQLAALDRRNFPANGATIDSLINDEGVATPVVTRKSGDNFLVVALAPGTLIGVARTSSLLPYFSQSLIQCRSRKRPLNRIAART